MKRYKKIYIIIAGIVILSNVDPFTFFFEFSLDQGHYRYSNSNGSMTFFEIMERRLDMAKRWHSACLLGNSKLKDKNMYRLFSKNPLAFWRWRLYFFDERYKLPYKNWEEIKKVRAKEYGKGMTGCGRDF